MELPYGMNIKTFDPDFYITIERPTNEVKSQRSKFKNKGRSKTSSKN